MLLERLVTHVALSTGFLKNNGRDIGLVSIWLTSKLLTKVPRIAASAHNIPKALQLMLVSCHTNISQ